MSKLIEYHSKEFDKELTTARIRHNEIYKCLWSLRLIKAHTKLREFKYHLDLAINHLDKLYEHL